jgi:hypothetical protein
MAEKSDLITIRSALPAEVVKIDIFSNEDPKKKVDLRAGLVRLNYYESILQDTVRVALTYVDSGSTIEKDDKLVSAVEGLPIVGEERVELIFTDNNENEISFTMEGDNSLYINKYTPVMEDSTRSLVMLDLVSAEYILNEKMRLNTRFDGKISDHVKGILTKQTIDKDDAERKREKNYLDSKKKVFIENTTGDYSFIGNNKKPFYTMNWLSKKAVPGGGKDRDDKDGKEGDDGALGNSAGFFLWETAKGFHFRSIDWLMDKEMNPKKKSIIYNDTSDGSGEKMPKGYDIKALSMDKDNRLDIQKKLMMGAFSTRTIVFNPFNCVYEVITPNAYGDKDTRASQDNLKLAGSKLPVMNPEFDMDKREGGDSKTPAAGTGNAKDKAEISKSKEFSRTQYMFLDHGTLIDNGSKDPKEWTHGTRQQLQKSQKTENFHPKDILSQSSMRYNQLFSTKIGITIPGDFSLNAGDSIFFDGPELTGDQKKDNINEKDGGLYIIADLCHYSTSKETYTRLNLVRDSTERKGTATGG